MTIILGGALAPTLFSRYYPPPVPAAMPRSGGPALPYFLSCGAKNGGQCAEEVALVVLAEAFEDMSGVALLRKNSHLWPRSHNRLPPIGCEHWFCGGLALPGAQGFRNNFTVTIYCYNFS